VLLSAPNRWHAFVDLTRGRPCRPLKPWLRIPSASGSAAVLIWPPSRGADGRLVPGS
jgi:hypothetical protein